jgi:hypothetical protein
MRRVCFLFRLKRPRHLQRACGAYFADFREGGGSGRAHVRARRRAKSGLWSFARRIGIPLFGGRLVRLRGLLMIDDGESQDGPFRHRPKRLQAFASFA